MYLLFVPDVSCGCVDVFFLFDFGTAGLGLFVRGCGTALFEDHMTLKTSWPMYHIGSIVR